MVPPLAAWVGVPAVLLSPCARCCWGKLGAALLLCCALWRSLLLPLKVALRFRCIPVDSSTIDNLTTSNNKLKYGLAAHINL